MFGGVKQAGAAPVHTNALPPRQQTSSKQQPASPPTTAERRGAAASRGSRWDGRSRQHPVAAPHNKEARGACARLRAGGDWMACARRLGGDVPSVAAPRSCRRPQHSTQSTHQLIQHCVREGAPAPAAQAQGVVEGCVLSLRVDAHDAAGAVDHLQKLAERGHAPAPVVPVVAAPRGGRRAASVGCCGSTGASKAGAQPPPAAAPRAPRGTHRMSTACLARRLLTCSRVRS